MTNPDNHAIEGMTRALAAESGPIGVAANAITPGPACTDAAAAARTKALACTTSLGRAATAVVAFLGSPSASYIAGIIAADGGCTAIQGAVR